MVKKKTNTKQEETKHKCGECRHGKDVTKHNMLNLQGEPFCVKCQYQEFARLKREDACEHFARKL